MKKQETSKHDFKAREVSLEPISFSTFTALYNSTIDQLYLYGTKITPDKTLVKDCIQEVYIDVFINWNKIRNPQAVKFYLLKALKHEIYQKLKFKRQNDSFDYEMFENHGFEQSFEEEIINAEEENSRDRKIQKALDELTPKLKEILFLKFTMGFTYKEIGWFMDINLGSAKKQTYRALGKLRKFLDKNSL